MSPYLPWLLAGATLSSAQPAASNLTATVNDPSSPGAVGDQLLSLDEAVRLANGSLLRAQLSAAESAQITGTGTAVDCIVIDAAITPTITLTAAVADVLGNGLLPLMIQGMPVVGLSGAPVRPQIQAGSQGHGLALRTPLVTVMGLQFDGGQLGLDVRTIASGMNPGQQPMVMDCRFRGQATAGVRLHGQGTDHSGLMVMQSEFEQMPLGYQVDDQTVFGWTMLESEFVTMDGVTVGADVVENGQANLSMWHVFRSTFRNGDRFLRVRRTPGSTQQLMIRIVHCDLTTALDTVDVQGIAGATTMVHHHHSQLVAGAGHKAMFCWPRTAEFDFHGSENEFTGDVSVAANLFSQRIWQQNNSYRNSVLTLDVDGAAPNLIYNRFVNGSLLVPATARTPVTVRQGQLANCAEIGQSPLAPITLDGCYLSSVSLAGQAGSVNPATAPFLGVAAVTPTEPRLGTGVAFDADLPFGIGAFWHLANAISRPNTAAEPFRLYADPQSAVLLPGMVVFFSHTVIPIPNNPGLLGIEMYAQPVTIPLLGQPWVPVFHLPRGGLIRLRP